MYVSAYTHGSPRRWNIECHGAYDWQECRFSPAGWQIMYDRYLTECLERGYMPLADIWLDTCRRIASERADKPGQTLLLDVAEQWAEDAPAQGGAE